MQKNKGNKGNVNGDDDVTCLEVWNNIKEKIDVLLIRMDGDILFPLRVMYKRSMNKINKNKNVMIMVMVMVMLILFMIFIIFIFFKNLYDVL